MSYFFIAGALLLAALAAYQYLRNFGRRRLMRALRWIVGGLAALAAVALLLARRIDMAIFAGALAFSVLRAGRLGAFSFESGPEAASGNVSSVKSYRFAMELDHDTGSVSGRVLNGQFAGADLMDLGEMETRIEPTRRSCRVL